MKYIVVDISGKVLSYDVALTEALSDNLDNHNDQVLLVAPNIRPKDIKCPSKKLFSFRRR